jgi:hypothetical protein
VEATNYPGFRKTFVTLGEIHQKLRPLLEPPPPTPKPEIGFHVKEDAVPYRTKRKDLAS